MGVNIIVSVLSNDTDADQDNLTVSSVSNGNSGTCTTNGTTIVYTPSNTLWAGYDTVTYTISDGNGGTSNATVYIQSGTTAQINSYNIIAPYFGTQMTMFPSSQNKITLLLIFFCNDALVYFANRHMV